MGGQSNGWRDPVVYNRQASVIEVPRKANGVLAVEGPSVLTGIGW